jgi:DNA-binding response OmpR family regulator
MAKILLIEDEEQLSQIVSEWLSDEKYLVETIADGMLALELLQKHEYDLIILDLMLPGMHGVEVCKSFRAGGGNTPILILTARSSLAAKESGLDAGADDYLTKPFQLRELSARIRALLRRAQTAPGMALQVGNLCLDRKTFQVFRDGQEIQLIPKEFALLEFFMRHQGEVLSTETLLDRIWGSDTSVVPETVRSTIRTLRHKIDIAGNPSIIKTIHGMGYKIEAH